VEVAPSADLPGLDEQVQAVAAQIRKVLDELHRARREAMQAERLAAVGELAAGVAHELRNPLTSVKLLIQTAAQRSPGQALGERPLQIVQHEIERMERTIQGLLDFARPPRLHRVRHDVRETLQRALNLVVGRAAQQEVTVQTDLPPTPVEVEADPEQLHQVFVNLLLNSMDSMANGGLLRIALEAQAIRGGTCRIVFSDSGLGIPDAVLERLFEPFVTTKDRGTGLGLAISRRIVEEHHGRILAANCGGQGASFTVELPLAAAPSGGGDVAEKAATDCTVTRSGEGEHQHVETTRDRR
jgi:signal transduction histidine kinase